MYKNCYLIAELAAKAERQQREIEELRKRQGQGSPSEFLAGVFCGMLMGGLLVYGWMICFATDLETATTNLNVLGLVLIILVAVTFLMVTIRSIIAWCEYAIIIRKKQKREAQNEKN